MREDREFRLDIGTASRRRIEDFRGCGGASEPPALASAGKPPGARPAVGDVRRSRASGTAQKTFPIASTRVTIAAIAGGRSCAVAGSLDAAAAARCVAMSPASRHDRRRRRARDADVALPASDGDDGGEHPKAAARRSSSKCPRVGPRASATRPTRPHGAVDAAIDAGDADAALVGAPLSRRAVRRGACRRDADGWRRAARDDASRCDRRRDRSRPPAIARATRRRAGAAAVDAARTPSAARRWSAWSASLLVHALIVAAAVGGRRSRRSSRADEIDLSIAPAADRGLRVRRRRVRRRERSDARASLPTSVERRSSTPATPTLGMEAGAGARRRADRRDRARRRRRRRPADGPAAGSAASAGCSATGRAGWRSSAQGLGGAADAAVLRHEDRRPADRVRARQLRQHARRAAGDGHRRAGAVRRRRSTPDQEFYVDLLQRRGLPAVLSRSRSTSYVRPTERNKQLLPAVARHGRAVPGRRGGRCARAAASIEPDTVFLLSDGRIQGERKMAASARPAAASFRCTRSAWGWAPAAAASRRNLAGHRRGQRRRLPRGRRCPTRCASWRARQSAAVSQRGPGADLGPQREGVGPAVTASVLASLAEACDDATCRRGRGIAGSHAAQKKRASNEPNTL